MENNYKEYPVITELKSRVSECRNELLKLLDDWHYLQNILHPRLMFLYNSLFGDLEFEYQEKHKSAIEIDRRIELLSIRLKKGEKLTESTIKFINDVVRNELIRNERQQNNFIHNRFCNDVINSDYQDNTPKEIPTVYRKLVTRLHPDINGESPEFLKFWDNVQDAYKNSNLHRLKLFYQTLCPEEYIESENLKHEETRLRSEIRQLELNIISEQQLIRQMKEQEPFVFEEKLTDKLWIARRKRKLQDRIFQIERHIHYNKKLLSNLTTLEKPAFGEMNTSLRYAPFS